MKRNNKKGFTIVELVIVIAVIAILAAVLIPTYASLVEKANLSADQVAVRNMNTALRVNNTNDGGINNVEDARAALYVAGYNGKNLIPTTADYSFYWNQTNNEVILVDKDNAIVYPAEYKNEKISGDKFLGKVFNLGNLPYAKITEVSETVTLNGENTGTYNDGGQGSATLSDDVQLDKVLQFEAVHTKAEAEELPYAEYIVDYVITINKKLDEDGTEYYLAGNYGSYQDGKWVVLKANNAEAGSYRLLKDLLGQDKWTYTDICEIVKKFACGIAVTGNGDSELTVKVELVMWENETDYVASNGSIQNGQVVSTYVYSYAD